ncbi:MAG: RNA-binding protein [Arcobacteraceae bacterium]
MQIYIGNMNYKTNEESITTLFSDFGEVDSVVLITDSETGRSKGFGFVTMNDTKAAQSAIEALNEKEFEGRALRINEAQPKKEK